MATLAELDAAIAECKTAVEALIAKQPPPPQEPDVQAEVDAVNAITAEANQAAAQ